MDFLPKKFTDTLSGLPGMDLAAFLRIHEAGEKITSLRINPNKLQDEQAVQKVLQSLTETTVSRVPWSQYGYYLPVRPSFTFDPFFHAGAYYVQEASSMFVEQVMRHVCDLDAPLKVLDLCAAPGGKSTLLQSIISADSVLVSNEVIKSRAALLGDNISKWGAANVVVTNNDPRDFGRLPGYFDVMVVDAPCSGSGLFRREPEAVEEWSPENVMLCSQRQQRILADVWNTLKENGILIYATCSYSRQEDEEIMEWIQDNFSVENIAIPVSEDWHIVKTTAGPQQGEGYRFYPDKVKGEGFFITCFRKTSGDEYSTKKQRDSITPVAKKEQEKVAQWLKNTDNLFMMDHQGEVLIFPENMASVVSLLQQHLYLRKAGVKAGQLAAKELIPDHQLAMSNMIRDTIPQVTLTREQSLRYLRKEDPEVTTDVKGWALMKYEGMALGWAKILPNRINNYYPKELRILKEV
ncbi:methyltransferase RsmF C-terminal domain-like protein [Chitinophaga pinensis]|uniref:Fmu (Sun) domain protein n=1 Tax=Chitinophaga pinensis (strain ATCC 43595 / DSM 2588 / LMG 13176 / NBRC 15968 / NCIMB 11800 / UQM 2034) TaxID=485918 RepID=A0A979GTM6_CHIPD|nr:RNA methyltransferase [Chitinophaga pinensis]ACU63892.1 Fmu (Sun) domain protein [Chitinophaga pinensis DSM 2588]